MAFKLKKGEVLHPFGPSSRVDNENLTDRIARFILEKHPEEQDKFEDNAALKAWEEAHNPKQPASAKAEEIDNPASNQASKPKGTGKGKGGGKKGATAKPPIVSTAPDPTEKIQGNKVDENTDSPEDVTESTEEQDK